MNSAQRLDPIFILAMHRSGSSLLARLLNCHPDVVIWGEHMGFINKFADISDMVKQINVLMEEKTDAQIAAYVEFKDEYLTSFDPWGNPFSYSFFCEMCKNFIVKTFTRGVSDTKRWGFKEIRYHDPLTIQFLADLFPNAQFVFLHRDISDVVVSAVLAPWSLATLPEYLEIMPVEIANAIISDALYAAMAIELDLNAVEFKLPERALRLSYSELLDRDCSFTDRMASFLRLSISDETKSRMQTVLEFPVGATDRNVCVGGILSADLIRSRVAELEPVMAIELQRHGVDRQRLRARVGTGRFSYLMGDNPTDRWSSLF